MPDTSVGHFFLSGAFAQPRVEVVPQTVTHQVEAEHGDRQSLAGMGIAEAGSRPASFLPWGGSAMDGTLDPHGAVPWGCGRANGSNEP